MAEVERDYDGTPDERIMKEAKDRFKRCRTWESTARRNFLDDYKFFNADAMNGYQWPNELRKNRDTDARPCLTINKTRQHCLQIINDAKQNKPGVSIRPTGNGATFESAQCLEGIVRHIEYISNASIAYDTATTFQVAGGIGYLRVVTDYMDDKSFDQEIYIRPVDDPLTVYVDPDAKGSDKLEMRYGFVFDEMDKDTFRKRYPRWIDKSTRSPLGDDEGWLTEDMVRVAEYWRRVEIPDTLYLLPSGPILKSSLPKEVWPEIEADDSISKRPTRRLEIQWFLIIGEEIAERKAWPGKYIPIIPVIGEETIIEGQLDRKGHVRAMLDPQRMYNYWTSSAVEFVALQGKSPWVASAEAIEGYEAMWNTANRTNHSVLIFNALDDAAQPLAPPTRPAPPQMAPAYMQGMQVAGQELMFVSGQYQSLMGEPSNERSGKAINERQRQGENATYHYIDNLGVAIRCLGKILLDLIPKIYDVERVIMIMAEDGTDLEVELNPAAQKAYIEQLNEDRKVAKRVFNPNVGIYEVQAEIGPAYATKREQAFEALMQIMTQAPATTSIIGDILFKSADFPMADEAAARLRRMVPPQALGDGPTQSEQALTQQLAQIRGAFGKAIQELAETRLKLKAATGDTQVDVYKAETERAKVVWDHMVDSAGVAQADQQLQLDMLDTVINAAQATDGEGSEGGAPAKAKAAPKKAPNGAADAPAQLPLPFPQRASAPVEGAQRARDGHWYIRHPNGKYLMVG